MLLDNFVYCSIALWMVFLAMLCVPAVGTSMRLNANPIRRVVSMLQMMQKKIETEAKVEQDLLF